MLYPSYSTTTANKLLNSQPIFNGPFKRAELVLHPQYAASDNFLTTGKWAGEKNYVFSVNNEDENTTEPLLCIVVGVISAEKAYLAKHGNFNSTYNEDASKAKIQFSIIHPSDPDFGPDFDNAIITFKEYQRRASETPHHRYFLLQEERTAMHMNFVLFEPKVCTQNNHYWMQLMNWTAILIII